MNIENILRKNIEEYLLDQYCIPSLNFDISRTKKDFVGHLTVVLFPLIPIIKKSPNDIAFEIVNFLNGKSEIIQDFNVIQGFLNISFKDSFLISVFDSKIKENKNQKELFLIEFSSPNTNKPLHLGHIRNILLGDSVSRIFQHNSINVHKTQIINDRGIHICKSMVAWMKFGNDSSPESEGLKGDHFVGKYYVKYNEEFEHQVKKLVLKGFSEDEAKKNAQIFIEAQEMLLKWEANDKDVINLWKKMNSWVYEGFDQTYKKLNVDFDSMYYESNTYLTGKDIVLEGLSKNVFFKKEDGSIWVDLTSQGLDEKLLLRSDGTSVYITQDIGTAYLRYKNHPTMKGMIYTTGNEQDYHFDVLFKVIGLIGYPWSSKLKHLSYGMVDLPSGKMKSREGTVVDADELIDQMVEKAKSISESLGKTNDYSDHKKNELYKTIALGALKYHILKVDPKKRILFDPTASIDFNGNTGPFIQYTYARIKSLEKKNNNNLDFSKVNLNENEREIIIILSEFDLIAKSACKNLNPALIANYIYELVKSYNSFYQSSTILGNKPINSFRIQLSLKVGEQIKTSMNLLGIDMPERM
ncbi:MAG: arginine--tRNA ligase [Flavobacteriaceae bacterium]|nr:arginine--tRNA ligase [Flavobacteriaceae bacterium]MBL6684001.1 arginine--tRNA ligase [Flavobacteriaceae bacterium]